MFLPLKRGGEEILRTWTTKKQARNPEISLYLGFKSQEHYASFSFEALKKLFFMEKNPESRNPIQPFNLYLTLICFK